MLQLLENLLNGVGRNSAALASSRGALACAAPGPIWRAIAAKTTETSLRFRNIATSRMVLSYLMSDATCTFTILSGS